MPKPRKPHRQQTANGTRASRRNARDSAWVLAKLQERFDRFAELAELKRQQEEADPYFSSPYAKEKAPDLSTGGSSSSKD